MAMMICEERVASPDDGSRATGARGESVPFTPAFTERLLALIRRLDGESDPVLRPHIARVVAAITALRAVSALTPGSWTHDLEPVAGSVGALVMTRAADAVADLAAAVLGDHAVIDFGDPDTIAWSEFILGVPVLHVVGCTDEFAHAAIAGRGLGLSQR
ncbi:hypothetical protein [Gordonia sp. NB41Y]|uniref:hypothetical protein n=1 Tax=Gordonia sp. NB41Y TaxID=875808 RepID=UPI00128FB540|nr:hypothetical protein [Gordonia sp. NB41Y]WLP88590.1 hypothetical protein Q9K23_13240 [Gordonia sp. NB41Y]